MVFLWGLPLEKTFENRRACRAWFAKDRETQTDKLRALQEQDRG